MKKIKFILLIGMLAMYSCKKDKMPAISDITITPNPVGTTRNADISASITDAENINWYIDGSISSTASSFSWKATSPGMHLLKLEASGKAGSVTKEDTINVIDFDFRNVIWGDNATTVTNSETNDFIGDSDNYYYFAGDADNEIISYNIDNSGLIAAAVIYIQEYNDYSKYLVDYQNYVSDLDMTYGNHQDLTYWYDAAYQNDTSSWGQALENYLVEFGAGWQTDRDDIIIVLYRDNTDGAILFGTIFYPIGTIFKSTDSGKNSLELRNMIHKLKSDYLK